MSSRRAFFHPARFFLDAWREIDADASAARAARATRGLGDDYRPLIALLAGAAILTALQYWGQARTFSTFAAAIGVHDLSPRFAALYPQAYWAVGQVVGFFLIPALLIRLSGARVRDQGLAWAGLRHHLWIYAVLLVPVFAVVVAISFTGAFSTFYPLYHGASRSWVDLGVWELLYASQFFALEFFFRGWWLTACREAMGSRAIFAMVIPYCLIHYAKPAPEAFAAIIAGVVLGTLAMKTRSVWGGVLLHVTIAWSMDLAALLQTTGLPHQLWPQL